MSMAEKDYRDWCRERRENKKGKNHTRTQYSSDFNKTQKPYVAKVKDTRHKKVKIFFDED